MPALSPRQASTQLIAFFEERGYVRTQNAARLTADGYARYKKGSEVRLVFESASELRHARACVAALGLRAGKPFRKSSQLVLPFYGAAAVQWFLTQIGKHNSAIRTGFDANGKRVWYRSGRGRRAR